MLSNIHFLFLIIAVLFSSSSLAYSPTSALPAGSRNSLILESLSSPKATSLSENTEQLFPPASTLKLVTALAAKLELGDNFHYQTSLLRYQDDLIIQFSGDPTLTTQNLRDMLQSAKTRGTHQIKGDIWLDNSIFSGYDRAVGWPWDILGVCYSAPASAITLDENCVQASIYTLDTGLTRVYVPEQFPIHVSTKARTVSKVEQESSQCDLELLAKSNNQYQLNGCLVERSKPLPLKFAVQSPEQYTTRMVYTLLNQLNIELYGSIKIGRPDSSFDASSTTLLTQHKSATLPALLDVMLKKSDNLIADNLTKTIGQHFYLQPGSFSNGTSAMKQIIWAKTGINLEQARLVDGSGLSRNNRFTSQDMASILRYIWIHDDELNLVQAMPTSGKTGTLQYRSSMRKAPIKGQIIAKSGSVYGSYNMAGYGLDKKGKPSSLFVQFVTDYHPIKSNNNKPVIAPITQFEQYFYKDIVSFSQQVSKP
ncbi:serine-type D-Ala-D-Ala carboxypeptidase [Vibrio genomosp. F10]|uniref:Serine-type D-Ala-D-Ala carboxypeptidase n=1 Tax=Vibrio genomosp. F10 TaxID=723171 RepID=A0A1B9QVH1_9VIBR|nr:serine-type D-Ala-D-Ala carboxypeptidase [Vibrio genomosp. F10]OCH72951.1 serine-type D-Ala-D-Ala carboxypeptidase [Vibrio genomosp. F10]OEF04142.1 serine-type D-Ala-D-Ala carboxypeptidase [Vibrio genomosp. F10 str. 9ZB36]